ncbi:TPA: arylamine N-acetyltransferase [Pseudomonas aeruginosa]|uniref:Arylamine N-acetyltransferase n=2 Tax=Pseudomonas aeruginosa group TaxID=136841 RepID=A0ABD7K3G1_PSEAI|nr:MULTISPECIES: arylamine N-acetyltransferase [Pseudomonas aeruginosa group]ABR82460.1 putative N-hydroxyarylamine O-acetyltransferase [Pseudomonas aeruginosa PA7]KSC40487.1 arylamine N-acetyltransferase [Pseudomonas paraeruginosa]KSC84860.1 arylamine N-acetyltransferase [Pseudomonas aeruginosa]KSD15392.1 arylamine N-acetyltransferase [Pseudomonas aeruginosa]KSG44686.1 arylamine N-acetyltransferase [Pseudomonas aeruginosa]
MTPLTSDQTRAYLNHLAVDDPGPPSLANLDRLIDAHLRRVAFENLDVLLERPIEIDADRVFAKVVEGSRGGYCFELNSLFARLLLALDYRLELLVARVRWGLPEDAPLTQQSHLMLRVYLAEGEFLVDVGFGSANPPRALPLPGDQGDPGQAHCVRLLDPHAGLYESAVRGRHGWLPLYRFDLRAQLWLDYIPRNWYTSTHPHSVFRQGLKAAISEGDLRLTLADGLFGQRAGDGETLQRQVSDVDELLDILQTRFRLRLDPLRDVPALARRLAGLIAA